MDAAEARSHVWMLKRIGLRLEALALERIETRLEWTGNEAFAVVTKSQIDRLSQQHCSVS
jgi:hypothetical protein